MKVVKVKIVLGMGFDSWTQYFSNYPSLETIKLRLKRNSRLHEFASMLHPKKWVAVEHPDKITQTVFVCGVPIGVLEMSEMWAYECEECHPMKTKQDQIND